MSIVNPQSSDIELSVLNAHSQSALSDSPVNPVLLVQQPIQSDNSPTLQSHRTLNSIDPSPPIYAPSAPATTTQPGSSERNLEVDDELLRYTLTHDRSGIPVVRPPEPFLLEDVQSFQSHETFPPPYGTNEPPIYRPRIANAEREPKTLAMLFFKFGFCTFCSFANGIICRPRLIKFTVFPPFWVFGALMLITPLRSPNPLSPLSASSAWPPNTELIAWCNENIHTEADKVAFLAKMQEVEMKWARRCFIALSMLVCFSVAVGATIVGVLKVT